MDTHKLETIIGNLYLSFTDGKHVHVSSGRDTAVSVRQVQYHIGVHMYQWSDGSWNIGQESGSDYDCRLSLHATRSILEHATEPARKRIAEETTLAVRNFIVNNPGILQAAEVEHRQNNYDKLVDEVFEAKMAYDKLVQKRIDAHEALMEAKGGKS